MSIPTQPFGRTGHMSTRAIFGAAALGRVTQKEADRTLEVLQRYGVNHIDCAASYGDAELRIAPWLAQYRSQFFVATKTDARTAEEAKEELHRSLKRMGIDYVDLWQLHNLVDPIEWDTALSPGGAIDAAIDAKKQGLIRAVGVTGHGAQIAATHRRSLERFDFDSVLLPYNYVTMQSPYYREQYDALLKTCQEKNVAVQTIKSVALRPWMSRDHTRSTWYQPLESQDDIDLAVWWAMARRDVFLNSVGDVDLLPRVLDAASRYDEPPEDEVMDALVARTHTEPLFV